MNFLYAEFRQLRINFKNVRIKGLIVKTDLEKAYKFYASSIITYISFGAAIPNNRIASPNTSATHEQ